MKMSRYLYFILLISSTVAQGESQVFSSMDKQTTLIELYTSEGCSSCPPAERWLNELKDDQGLWKEFVPVAFHVDYWNYLGWKDQFSKKEFTQRQYSYSKHRYTSTVYTPGVIKNGREWRGWYSGGDPLVTNKSVGVLSALIDNDDAQVSFTPVETKDESLILHIALLGFNLSSHVVSGENTGKHLQHDFVVLEWHQYTAKINQDKFNWIIKGLLSKSTEALGGMAFWVTGNDDPTPIQATGGMLITKSDGK
jgi:hypothetical protein